MRTTLTIDDDVAHQLEDVRRKKGKRLKEIVNEALRAGLQTMLRPGRKPPRFETRTVSVGHCLIGSIDDVSEALALGEGEAFR